jgi:hypothetical protein
MRPIAAPLPLLTAGLLACAPKPDAADLVVVNAHIYTADSAHWTAEALAVKGGRIVFVGSQSGAMKYKGDSTKIEDVAGATVVPGLTDAHGHVVNLGLRGIDLMGTATYDEVIAKIAERAKATPKGEWILGRGWDQNDWPEKSFPTHDKLSAAVPNNPVYLTRVDGHAGLANAVALKLAKITAGTKDPVGGRVEHTANGAPSGVFVDNAQALMRSVIPPATLDQTKAAILAAQEQMHRWGLTGVHDAGEAALAMQAYDELGKAGQLDSRFYVMLSDNAELLQTWFARNPAVGAYDGRLWVRMIKGYMDGALGSRGAALLAPYSDDPKNSGLLLSTPEHIRELADQALLHGYQLGVHAIGDRGNRLVLDAYEAALKAHPSKDPRFRIEHAQILDPADIPRFKQLGVIPSMQASHQTSDMYWAKDRLGESRLVGAYAWQSLLKTGVIVPNGSDFPVEKVNPLISFHSAISRQDDKNWPDGGWQPQERMTRDQAFLAMTMWPAYAAFQEAELGSITVGKRADFVVLDKDIMKVPAAEVLATGVVATYVGGKLVYHK